MIIAVIPAREGSKRLPGKNLADLGGRPLITYSVLLARSIPEIDLTVAASDSQEILNVGLGLGADVCLLPSKLTGDDAKLIGSLQWVVSSWEGTGGTKVDWVVLLQPVCPLRLVDQCRWWIHQVTDRSVPCDGLLTVDCDTYKLGTWDESGYYLPNYEPGVVKQQIKPQFRENGNFYMLNANNIKRGELFGPQMLPVECREEQSLCNIDYQFDLDLTKWAFDFFGYRSEFDKLEEGFKS